MAVQLQRRIEGIKLNQRYRRGTRRQRLLRERVDLTAVEASGRKRKFVGGEIDSVRIRSDVRVIAEAERAVVVGRASGAIVLSWDAIDGVRAERTRSQADREI